MNQIFTIIFYQPVLNILVFFYNILPGHDMGLVIIALTITIKALLWPLSQKAIKSQQALNSVQPKIKEIQSKYKDDREKQGQALMELYKKEKVSPSSSCLPLLIQLPFLLAVFRVFRDGLANNLALVYSFIHRPELIETISFGIIDLAQPNYILAILTGVAQYFQAKIMTSRIPSSAQSSDQAGEIATMMNRQMMYMMPVMTVIICWNLPSGLALYWLLSSFLTIIQQHYLFKKP